ncbi:hypothetical protein [Aeromonas veronii]|uniref:hypothetical protein n=1 Tax=Aeromonas veronii TaxID=654 RepID=UPI003BA148D1
MKPIFKIKQGVNTFTTPIVSAQYPYLVTPDTKFRPEGDLKVNFTVPDNEYWREVIDQCESDIAKLIADFKEKNNKKLRESPDVPWIENDDGTITFKCKIRASYARRNGKGNFDVKVTQFDAKGTPIVPMVEIKGGSEIKLSLELKTWESSGKAGISLRPRAVQVIKLSDGVGSANSEEYGFDEEEGYVFEKEEEQTPFAEDGVADGEDERIDF